LLQPELYMRKAARFLLVCLLIAVCCMQRAKATHIVGGDLTYKHIANDSFEITLVLYVDCFFGNPAAISSDATAMVAVFTSAGTEVKTMLEPRSAPVRINSVNLDCVVPPANACVDQYIYKYYTTLPFLSGGYVLAFQRCCRNNTIKNIVDPQASGATYWCTVPDSVLSNGYNNAAVFTSLPPNYLCTNVFFSYDHSATDADGDSLSYELYTPYLGADQFNSRPLPPSAPPYPLVNWQTGYNAQNMMQGNPELNIDPVTGVISVKPQVSGQYVVGIAAKEYRNGQLINISRRDFQFNVFNCVLDVVSAFAKDIKACSDTVRFSNTSLGATDYFWDFGDTLITSDTSRQFEPMHVYTNTGRYGVKLIANKGNCFDSLIVNVTIDRDIGTFAANDTTVCPLDSIRIGANSSPLFNYSWSPGTYLDNSAIPNPLSTPPQTITYLVTRTSELCVNIDTVNITVNTPQAFAQDIAACTDTVTFTNNSLGATNYFWDFGDTLLTADTSRQFQPTHVYDRAGQYQVILIANQGNCYDSATVEVDIYRDIGRFAANDTVVCPGDPVRIGTGSSPGFSYLWSPDIYLDSPSVSNPLSIPYGSVTYYVTRTSQFCLNRDTVNITVNDPRALFSPKLIASCNAATLELDSVISYPVMKWYFNDQPSSQQALSEALYTYNTPARFKLIVSDKLCFDTLEREIAIVDTTVVDLIPNVFTPNGDGLNDCYRIENVTLIKDCSKLVVYNRWGRIVYNSDKDGDCWTGNEGINPLAQGVYFYILQHKGKDYHGSISLLR
jgi:gliding motility-associated-like protein